MADYFLRDSSTLGQLLGSLTVDLPSVMPASAIGAAAGSMLSGSAVAMGMIGGLACGPFVAAFVVGVVAGVTRYKLDEYFHLHEKIGEAYDTSLSKLRQVRDQLGVEAETRFDQLAHSHIVHDLSRDAASFAAKLARETDRVRGELLYLW